MSEPKPFASLSSGLLARKGMAKPAMRPQGFGQASAGLDDLGWNDMGHVRPQPEVPSPYEAPHEDHVPSRISALTPMNAGEDEEEEFEPAPPVVEQQRAAIAASFAAPQEPRSVLATKAKKLDEPEEVLELEEAAEPIVEEPQAEQAEPEPEIVKPAPVPPMPVRAAESRPVPTRQPEARGKSKAAFTLRLEAERHLKLRLACAVTGRSAQQLVTEALDQLLQSKPEVEALAEQVPGKARKPD